MVMTPSRSEGLNSVVRGAESARGRVTFWSVDSML